MLKHIVRHILKERQGLRTSNLVHGWRTTTRISHRRHVLQGQRPRLQVHMISLSRLDPMLYLSLQAGGAYRVGGARRPNFSFHCLRPNAHNANRRRAPPWPCGRVHSCANMDSPCGGQVHYTDAAAGHHMMYEIFLHCHLQLP